MRLILVNNTKNYNVSRNALTSSSSRPIGQIIAFNKGCIYFMQSFAVISANSAKSHIIAKKSILGLKFCCAIGTHIYRIG